MPAKTKKFLRFAGVVLQDDSLRVKLKPPDFTLTEVYEENRTIINALWRELEYYYRIRNCIVHGNGLGQKSRASPCRLVNPSA
ncbi:hypothetical protein ACFLV6_02860 [Chloroflexota bacterium]